MKVALPAIVIFAAAATGIGAIAFFGTMASASVLGPAQKSKKELLKIVKEDGGFDLKLNFNLNIFKQKETVSSPKRRLLSRVLKIAAVGGLMFGASILGNPTMVLNPVGKMLRMSSGQTPIPRADMFAKTIHLSEVTPPKTASTSLSFDSLAGVEIDLSGALSRAVTYAQTFGRELTPLQSALLGTMLSLYLAYKLIIGLLISVQFTRNRGFTHVL